MGRRPRRQRQRRGMRDATSTAKRHPLTSPRTSADVQATAAEHTPELGPADSRRWPNCSSSSHTVVAQATTVFSSTMTNPVFSVSRKSCAVADRCPNRARLPAGSSGRDEPGFGSVWDGALPGSSADRPLQVHCRRPESPLSSGFEPFAPMLVGHLVAAGGVAVKEAVRSAVLPSRSLPATTICAPKSGRFAPRLVHVSRAPANTDEPPANAGARRNGFRPYSRLFGGRSVADLLQRPAGSIADLLQAAASAAGPRSSSRLACSKTAAHTRALRPRRASAEAVLGA